MECHERHWWQWTANDYQCTLLVVRMTERTYAVPACAASETEKRNAVLTLEPNGPRMPWRQYQKEYAMKKLEDMTEPELREAMNAFARSIVAVAEHRGIEKPLFALVLFNDPRLGQYVANCERKDVIAALRETADRLERREDVTR